MNFFNNLIQTAQQGLQHWRKSSELGTKRVQLRLEKARMQRERAELFKRLGRLTLRLHQDGSELPTELTPLLDDLKYLENRIHEKEEAMQALSKSLRALENRDL